MIECSVLGTVTFAMVAAFGGQSTSANKPDASVDAPRLLDAPGPSYNAIPFTSGPDAPVLASLEYRCVDELYVEAQVVITATLTPLCASLTWPMDILVVDNTGHVTTGLVRGTHVD
jgi:hypothetical protein